jgi:hypothetical protein
MLAAKFKNNNQVQYCAMFENYESRQGRLCLSRKRVVDEGLGHCEFHFRLRAGPDAGARPGPANFLSLHSSHGDHWQEWSHDGVIYHDDSEECLGQATVAVAH